MLQKIKNFYHLLQAVTASVYYGFPSRSLKVIGVTGTDGKTTTTHLIYHILKSAGKKVSMISSIYASIGGKNYDTGFHVTTPDVFPLHKFLRQSVNAGDEYFVLETTSHALSQNRTAFIDYEMAVLTNITHEHLDFHKTYEEYVVSKAILFQKSSLLILNKDDESYPLLKKYISKKYTSYALKQKADFRIDVGKKYNLELAEFNKYNYLAAYTAAELLGINESKIIEAFKSFMLPPGRLEVIQKNPYSIIIDFAHTPNAFRHVLDAVKKTHLKKGGKLIHVFGSAGLRDHTKRPLMGSSSGSFSDIVILTEEDYRTEDPQEIANQIAEGLKQSGLHYIDSNYSNNWNKKMFSIVLDRKQAIDKAIKIAKPGDVLIFTGKAHEKSLCRGKIEYPWNEKEAILKALKL